ncbi:DUF7227 family protein [Gemmata sp.]|uniref:DUF7227 family protein n=1 Tax=Gemmata sp. TaxID=1914242 RepID=UPI003F70500F
MDAAPEIDPDRLYKAAEVARLFGVATAQPRRWARRSATGPRSPMRGRFPLASERPWRVSGATLAAFRAWRSAVAPHPGVIAKAHSLNAKLGRAAATYVARQSCPASCPFRAEGCYAEHDNTRATWDRITAGSAGAGPVELARREAALIDGLPGTRDLRLHVAGDSVTVAGTRAIAAACGRYVERGRGAGCDVKVWAYTHAYRTVPRAAWGVVSVLASCETAADVAAARGRGYAAALVVPEFGAEAAHAAGGVRLLPCPQQTRGRACTDCRLCFDDGRLRTAGLVIGFALHGWGSNKARRALERTTRTPLPMAA